MELPSLLHNGKSWKAKILGEQALLLETVEGSLDQVHNLVAAIEGASLEEIIDVVPAYNSVALIFDKDVWNHTSLLQAIENLTSNNLSKEVTQPIIEVPVCYEMGLDWEEVTGYTGLSKEEVTQQHSSAIYTVAMMGFIPGFVFLEGLSDELMVPRKPTPRTSIPSGSVGIGGSQTGIYSLESPGGWNIIGRTPVSFFDAKESPPTNLKAGDQIRFRPISEEEFYYE